VQCAMAIGLELARPPLAVALLGLVAISYSLWAERSLWAGMRNDKVAKRAATSNVAMNVRDKYQRTKFELDGLPAARSTAERLDMRSSCRSEVMYFLA
jgi:hypothetical protein